MAAPTRIGSPSAPQAIGGTRIPVDFPTKAERRCMYVADLDGAARTQKILRYGATGCTGTGSAEAGKYVQ